MKEIIFAVSLSPEDIYVAEAFCYSIAVQAETPGELRCRVREAVRCHFENTGPKPATIRLHFTHYEEITVSPPPEQEEEWQEACSEYSEHASSDLELRAKPILGLKPRFRR